MDRRVYNGCLSDDLQAYYKMCDLKMRLIRVINPDAHCTYFPNEGKYQVHAWGIPMSKMHSDKMEALQEALDNLK